MKNGGWLNWWGGWGELVGEDGVNWWGRMG